MQKETSNEEKFCTTDLGLASALFAKQFDLSDVDRSDPNRVSFAFSGSDKGEIKSAAKQYWQNELDVKAKRYFESTKTLKNFIYQ